MRASTLSPTCSLPATSWPICECAAPRFCVSSTTKRVAARTAQLAGVADLPARLGVEHRAIQDHFAALARCQAPRRCAPSRSSATTRPWHSTAS